MNREETIANIARDYYGLATLDSSEDPKDFRGHFTTATRIALTLAYDAGYEAARPEAAEPPADAAEQEAARMNLFTAIARKELRVPTLEHRKSDRLDFHTVSVWGIQAALEAAYAAGQTATATAAEPPPSGEPDGETPATAVPEPTIVAHHRNGVSSAPFNVLLFTDAGPHGSRKLGIVFEAPHYVAVFDVAKLAAGDIAFGSNSWRGDQFERMLRAIIVQHDDASR